MLTVPFFRRLFAGGIALALLPALLSALPPDAGKDKPKPASPADKVRKDLDQTITFPGNTATLRDCLDVLHEQTKLNFVVDEKAFAALGCTNVLATDYTKTELPAMKDVRVKDLLRTFLKQVVVSPGEATYVVVGDKVVLTTDSSAPYRLFHQVVSLDCEKEELSAVLKRLGRETGTSLVLDARALKDGQSLVTLELQDVTVETAVTVLAETVGLKPVRIDNVLFLTTKERVKELREDPNQAHLIGPCPLPPEFGVARPLG
jgi:hypothetical protein